MEQIDQKSHLADVKIRKLNAGEFDAVAGGVGGWAMLAYAPRVLPPNPCFTALGQVVKG